MSDIVEYLQKSLFDYEVTSEDDALYRSRILELLSKDGVGAFSKNRFFDDENKRGGHIVASGLLINLSANEVLLTHHKKLNKWLQLGGHFEEQDLNIYETARRAVCEESCIDKKKIFCNSNKILDLDIHIIPENKKSSEPEHEHFDIRYIFFTKEREFVVSEESNELKWFSIEKLLGCQSKIEMSYCGSGEFSSQNLQHLSQNLKRML